MIKIYTDATASIHTKKCIQPDGRLKQLFSVFHDIFSFYHSYILSLINSRSKFTTKIVPIRSRKTMLFLTERKDFKYMHNLNASDYGKRGLISSANIKKLRTWPCSFYRSYNPRPVVGVLYVGGRAIILGVRVNFD